MPIFTKDFLVAMLLGLIVFCFLPDANAATGLAQAAGDEVTIFTIPFLIGYMVVVVVLARNILCIYKNLNKDED